MQRKWGLAVFPRFALRRSPESGRRTASRVRGRIEKILDAAAIKGLRVYFVRQGAVVYLLLCGGDKSSQGRDIEKAKGLLKGMKNDRD